MFLRKVVTWPRCLQEPAGNHADSSAHGPAASNASSDGSRHGGREFRRIRSADVLGRDLLECSLKPDQVERAVYRDDQRVIDAILAEGGVAHVRRAIVQRVSGETIRKLIEHGCRDEDFFHILVAAARFGHLHTLTNLLDHTGLTVHAMERVGNRRNSLLYAASQAGQSNVVRCLLRRGADSRVGRFVPGFLGRHLDERSCLETAVRGGHLGVTSVLLQNRAVAPQELNRLLDIALHDEDPRSCQLLIDYGALPDVAVEDRLRALRDPMLNLALRKSHARQAASNVAI